MVGWSMASAGVPVAGSSPPAGLIGCEAAGGRERRVEPRLTWQSDERGWLRGHRLELSGDAGPSVGLGGLAFLDGPFGDRWVFGDARRGISHLRVLDARRGCVETAILIEGLVFTATIDTAGLVLIHDLVDAGSRRELGVWRRPLEDLSDASRVLSGVPATDPIGPVWANSFTWRAGGVLEARSCGVGGCVVRKVGRDGSVTMARASVDGHSGAAIATSAPRVDPRPVPETGPATWPQDALLTYRWAPQEPAAWVRRAVNDAAEDAGSSRGSRAARFAYDGSADDTVGLEPDMTGACTVALACAYGVIPNWWNIRIRPHGTQVDWGVVRWCQAYDDPPNGCYDLEHVMLHEFGHIEGLAHPEDSGFRLGVLETVMATAPPQKPATGWDLHRFGPCDVARLQRRYDVNERTRLAVCDRVETRLSIDASPDSIAQYQPVTITATLRVKDFDAYDRLGGNPLSGRAVVLERRTKGSTTWVPYEPDEGEAPGTYTLTFRPGAATEFRATFARPEDDGVTRADSAILTVNVGSCFRPPCPVADSPLEGAP